MFELCKGTKLIETLEKKHLKDLDEQKETPNEKAKEPKRDPRKLSPHGKGRKKDRKCWFHENGSCKKGDSCDFLHPTQICSNYNKSWQCPQGLMCALRHPLRICMSYMEGGCISGDACVLQHPISSSPPQRFPPSSPALSYPMAPPAREVLAQSLPYLAYPQTNFPFPPRQSEPSMAQPSPHGSFQTPPPSFSNVVSGMYRQSGSPSAHHSKSTSQQGFW
jgi:hypothetical protein